MLLKENTYHQQSLLAKYTRTGDDQIIEQLQNFKPKGIKYYRHLIFNIIYDGVSNAYPITTDFFGEEKMKELADDFFKNHSCQTFQVWEMPREFKDYIIEKRKDLCEQYPFLPDLLLFEWMEIEIFMMPDEPLPEYSNQGNILKDKLVLNPELQILFFQYPVHLYHPQKIKQEHKGEYFVLIHRHPDTKEVIFTELSPATVKIIEALYEQPLNFDEIQKLFPNSSLHQKNQLKKFIHQSIQNKIILGFKK